MRQVVEILGTIKKFVWFHPLGNIKWNGAKRGDDLSWAGLHMRFASKYFLGGRMVSEAVEEVNSVALFKLIHCKPVFRR